VAAAGGDGNCLFRSVAHQVYGDEALHPVLRAAAAEYISVNAHWFRGFVEGDFGAYLQGIRTPGTWGDDPEVQALSEIYDRPCEIWAYDAAAGATQIRVFYGSRSQRRPPLRLSFYGGGHYDSLVGADFASHLLTSRPGEHEAAVLERAQRWEQRRLQTQAGAQAGTEAEAVGSGAAPVPNAGSPRAPEESDAEQALLQAAVEESRHAFEHADASLDAALLRSMGIADDDAAEWEAEGESVGSGAASRRGSLSGTTATGAGDDVAQALRESRAAAEAAEAALVEQALADSLAGTDSAVEGALSASMSRGDRGTGVDAAADADADAEAEMERAIQLSLQPFGTSASIDVAGAGSAGSRPPSGALSGAALGNINGLEEEADPELQAALQASLEVGQQPPSVSSIQTTADPAGGPPGSFAASALSIDDNDYYDEDEMLQRVLQESLMKH
jgi:hypothetical protein